MKLKQLLTSPLKMNRRATIVLVVLLVIFSGALFIRLSSTLGQWLPLGRDGPYHLFHVNYLADHYPSDPYLTGTPPLFFHFAAAADGIFSAFGASRITAFDISTALASGLVVLTTFLMMRRLTKNGYTALAAAFFSAFLPASLRMMGELQKNALGVSLAPLAVLFLWRGLENNKKLDLIIAGVALGVVGLSHQLAFGALMVACVTYLGVLLAYHRRVPLKELKAAVIIAIPLALVAGWFYYGALATAGDLTANTMPPTFIAQGPGEQPLPQTFQESIYKFYDEYMGKPLLALAVVGGGVAVHRRKKSDLFLLAWGLSSLVMAQPWVDQGYQWRFVITLAAPVALLGAVGLVDGVGAFLCRIGDLWKMNKNRRNNGTSGLNWVGRGTFVLFVLIIFANQAYVSNTYAWTGQMLQPTISMQEYNSLTSFRSQFGAVYVFGSGERIFPYWPDAVGLKGTIQGSSVSSLSSKLQGPGIGAMDLAVEWYRKENEVGKIYALVDSRMTAQILENGQLFRKVFDNSSLRAYGLIENFVPPENYQSAGQQGVQTFSFDGPPQQQQPPQQPPQDGNPPQYGQQPQKPQSAESPALKALMLPVYMLPGGWRFAIGVPLTVMIWVLLPCLACLGMKKALAEENAANVKKFIVIGGVVLLVIVVFLLTPTYSQQMGPAP
ncbi:MAG: DUF6541 family protein [Candidatus Hadarchaeota archaeon]